MKLKRSLLMMYLIITSAFPMASTIPWPQGSQHGKPVISSFNTPMMSNRTIDTAETTAHPKEEIKKPDLGILNTIYQSRTPLGNAEVYIVLALLIGFLTVVIGCWLSDNCWSSEPEENAIAVA